MLGSFLVACASVVMMVLTLKVMSIRPMPIHYFLLAVQGLCFVASIVRIFILWGNGQ